MDNLGNTTLGITTDITGATRSATPDMGCYEFAPPVLDASISWVAPVGPFSPGLQTITVNILNTAVNTITDLTLSYTDGGTPVTESFSGLAISPFDLRLEICICVRTFAACAPPMTAILALGHATINLGS